MSREEVFAALDEVFQDEFDDDTLHVTDSTTADDIEDWDSLEHINLVVAVERRFGIKFTMAVGEMVDIILQRAK